MKRNRGIIFIFIAIFAASSVISGCAPRSTASTKSGEKISYHCPMHPQYTADRPGDCPICGMKLTKIEKKTRAAASAAGKEKTLEQVCLEHNCTMKNCAMHVKAELKPGEHIYCPICGEVIATDSGKVVEIIKNKPSAMSKKIKFYRNPMNPEITSEIPAKDEMGMDYVPVYDTGMGEEGPSVQISPEKQQLIGVTTEPVITRGLTKVINAFGKIAYDPNLSITQEEYIQAIKNLDNIKDSPLSSVVDRAKEMAEASKNKLKLLGMSDEEIAGIEKTGKAQTNLYLPGKGEDVWAYISVYEYEIGLVKVGASVEIQATAYPSEIFKGNVISINPVLDPMTRTNIVRVKVVNTDDKLKPEMFVSAKILVDLGEKLAAPESAVIDTGLRKIVYLSKEGDVLEAREVSLGRKAEGYYEVFSGLKEGDIVVTSGNFLVDSETKLKSGVISGE